MKNIASLFSLFVKWRVALFAITLLVLPMSGVILSSTNFDGQKFLNLAQLGYGTPKTYYSYNLFPFYPLLISTLSPVFGYLYSALFLSHFFAFCSLVLLYFLARKELSETDSKTATLLMLIYPSSFFLTATYSESLFLFLSLATLLSLRNKKLFLSVAFASLASYTRAAGIVLWLVILIEYFDSHKNWLQSIFTKNSLLLFIPPLGFFSYLKYLEVNTSDFLNFLPSLPSKFVFIHQVFIRYIKMIIFVDHGSYLFVVIATELILSLLVVYLLVFRFKQTRLSYWMYLMVIFFIPSLWGSFSGIGRFLLTCPPFFLILAEWISEKSTKTKVIYCIISGLLLAANLLIFSKGIFVG